MTWIILNEWLKVITARYYNTVKVRSRFRRYGTEGRSSDPVSGLKSPLVM